MSKLIGAPKKEQRRENCFSQKFNKKCNSYVQILKGPWPSTRPSDGNRNAMPAFAHMFIGKNIYCQRCQCPKIYQKGKYLFACAHKIPQNIGQSQIFKTGKCPFAYICLCPTLNSQCANKVVNVH